MDYKGHKLTIERHFYMGELEETYFEVKRPDGNYCHMDWSGYGTKPTEEDFALWVELGYPDREHPALERERQKRLIKVYSPLNSKDLGIIKEYVDSI